MTSWSTTSISTPLPAILVFCNFPVLIQIHPNPIFSTFHACPYGPYTTFCFLVFTLNFSSKILFKKVFRWRRRSHRKKLQPIQAVADTLKKISRRREKLIFFFTLTKNKCMLSIHSSYLFASVCFRQFWKSIHIDKDLKKTVGWVELYVQIGWAHP